MPYLKVGWGVQTCFLVFALSQFLPCKLFVMALNASVYADEAAFKNKLIKCLQVV